jgi:hypothetical protein
LISLEKTKLLLDHPLGPNLSSLPLSEEFMKKTAFALLAIAFAGSALAQNTITNASGVVTVTDPSGQVLQSVKIGDVVQEGSTLSTTGSVTVTVDGGACTATLSGGQSIVVTPASCQDFVAKQTPAASGGVLTPINLALGVGGLALLNEATKGNGTPAPISNN